MNLNNEIGLRLLAIRTEMGITADVMAKKLGFARGTYSGWENGEPLSKKAKIRLSDRVKINMDWLLFGGEGPMFIESNNTTQHQPTVLTNQTLTDKFRTISEDSDSIYLTSDELKKLHELNINEDLILDAMSAKILNVTGNLERMIVSLKDCRDRFLIGAYTAMRFSDYAFLSGVSYKDNFISRVSQKTGVKTVIPMHPIIRSVLEARGDKLPPKISNQKMNDQLKVLCKLAKINSPFEVTITKGGRKVRTVYEKWELATTHTARRSGATNMFLAGIDPISIMSFSGHKTVKSFMKYIKASAIDTAEKLKDHAYFK